MSDRSAVKFGGRKGRLAGARIFVCAVWLAAWPSAEAALSYVGVNLNGPEYGASKIPGVYDTDYTYPTFDEVDYFMSKGMNTFRVPFSWERMQPELSGPLDAIGLESQIGLMDKFVTYATSLGANVILDPHNFGAYGGEVIGAEGSSVTPEAFASLWSQLATHYESNDHVIFGLMNEPVGLNDATRPGGATEDWLIAANAAIDAIRGVGATNLILVPGNGYSGAWSWSSDFYGTANSEVMGGVMDPLNNFAYEVHQYLDADSSGTSDEVYQNNTAIGAQRLSEFTLWLKEIGARGFLGEFGAAAGAVPEQALDLMLDHLDANSDVWLGWTYWAAGPWNHDSFSIEPDGSGDDKPQLAVLEEHMAAVPEPGIPGMMAVALSLFAAAGLWRRCRAAS